MSTQFRGHLEGLANILNAAGWVGFWIVVAGLSMRQIWAVATGQADLQFLGLGVVACGAASWLLRRIARR